VKTVKLKHDCMRDCLLYLESVKNIIVESDADTGDAVSFEAIFIGKIFDGLQQWAKEDIVYSLFNLEQGGYINLSALSADNSYADIYVNYVTLLGHEFLDSVRDENRWKGVKNVLSAVRDYSLAAISAAAEGMTSAAISAYFSQQKPTS